MFVENPLSCLHKLHVLLHSNLEYVVPVWDLHFTKDTPNLYEMSIMFARTNAFQSPFGYLSLFEA